MGDLIRNGLAWLEGKRIAHLSSQAVYRHGGEELTVNATWGKTDFEIADDYGSKVASQVFDFLVAASELGFEPALGDEIVADGRIYQVAALAGEVFRWTSPFQTTYRIHTRMAGETAP